MNDAFAKHEGLPAKHLLSEGEKAMKINKADVAELVDARDLKSRVTPDGAQDSCKTAAIGPAEAAPAPARLQNNFLAGTGQSEIDSRLFLALQDAGHSALGMPSSVDTIKAMLARAGLALVLA